jgi:hypothetical protein
LARLDQSSLARPTFVVATFISATVSFRAPELAAAVATVAASRSSRYDVRP